MQGEGLQGVYHRKHWGLRVAAALMCLYQTSYSEENIIWIHNWCTRQALEETQKPEVKGRHLILAEALLDIIVGLSWVWQATVHTLPLPCGRS